MVTPYSPILGRDSASHSIRSQQSYQPLQAHDGGQTEEYEMQPSHLDTDFESAIWRMSTESRDVSEGLGKSLPNYADKTAEEDRLMYPSASQERHGSLTKLLSTPISWARQERSHNKKPQKQRLLSGWRAGAIISAVTALLVLILDTVLVIWVVANPEFPIKDGIGILYNGSCDTTKKANTWLHLGINILSTILLSASNYCMQCLSSPTRQEVNVAHANKTFLHIGVPSLHNLRRLSRDRVALWVLLAFSSLPLHFW